MKSPLFLVPLIFAATSAFAGSTVGRPDAHSQAAALLSGTHAPAVVTVQSPARSVASEPAFADAHAKAAAFLSGALWSRTTSSATVSSASPRISVDGHTQAAALLSGQRTFQ